MQFEITAIPLQTPYLEQPCSWSEALTRVIQGEIVVIRNNPFMQTQLQQFNQIVLNSLKTLINPKVVEHIEFQGWNKLHLGLTAGEIVQVNRTVKQAIQPFLMAWGKKFVRDLLQYPQPFYLYCDAPFRSFMPYELAIQHKSLLNHYGHLRETSPHRDSWFDLAPTTINLWITVGRVLAGNSMLLYPEQWGKEIPTELRYFHPEALYTVKPDYPLGHPLKFALEPGEALLFSAEHLHSSELNTTSDTRCSLTIRFSLQWPRVTQATQWNHWRPWYNSALVGTHWQFLASRQALFSDTYLRYRLKNQQKRWRSIKKRFFGGSTRISATQSPQTPQADYPAQATPSPSQELAFCQIETAEGMVQFPRYCPHTGADLSQGYIENGKLYCPWHSLAFDLKTGEPNCSAFRPLALTRLYP
uniref:Rieske (2Fe-2S) domain protein n=1 Tax=Cyanothece sp. (strain PCC 7425 / ATCC 29141) TaxID=395961 RepID=B8HSA1_CYAP4